MTDAETFIRGNIRYQGFCFTQRSLIDIGITSENAIPDDVPRTLTGLLQELTKDCSHHIGEEYEKHIMEIDFDNEDSRNLARKLIYKISEKDGEKVREIIRSFKFFKFFDHLPISDEPKTYLEAFCEVTSDMLSY